MRISARERRLAGAFVELADTLGDDFDPAAFLQRLAVRCVELLGAGAAGVVLVDHQGRLGAAAASDERACRLELFALRRREGPCVDCFRSAAAVPPLALAGAAADARWPHYAPRARADGYRAVYAVPLRRRETVVGALNILTGGPAGGGGPAGSGGLPGDGEVALAQALADAAAIGILQRRTVRQRDLLADQLRTALASRVVVEQAKGVLAERWGTSVDDAFTALRRYARGRRARLSDVARGTVDGTLDTGPLRPPGRPAPPRPARTPGPDT
ncbi:GAF and ANTAR domain-containing protein [Streptomyces sp. B1866]|uniref:GAF and ANTAR domain-containing protein n=1 Tax=Streptomyces sp. B1866 TaxID=3075431 RepID=UPI0028907293|nr:GAF and ANTAR domain-containing protein [Streptomyces sp. B1866]MDT3396622.1 GAF and ANTAR domain-containing protein [Streptomyces sp. B1866]